MRNLGRAAQSNMNKRWKKNESRPHLNRVSLSPKRRRLLKQVQQIEHNTSMDFHENGHRNVCAIIIRLSTTKYHDRNRTKTAEHWRVHFGTGPRRPPSHLHNLKNSEYYGPSDSISASEKVTWQVCVQAFCATPRRNDAFQCSSLSCLKRPSRSLSTTRRHKRKRESSPKKRSKRQRS